jgi:hypothetical protein
MRALCFPFVRNRTEQLPGLRKIFDLAILLLKRGMAMKNTFALKNTTRSILVATLMFAVAGVVQAQNSTAGQSSGATAASGGSGQNSAGKKDASGSAKKQGSSFQEQDNYIYGKDQARDYARAQGADSSGKRPHIYGKDAARDYEWSQGSQTSASTRAGSAGQGSSSGQGDYD